MADTQHQTIYTHFLIGNQATRPPGRLNLYSRIDSSRPANPHTKSQASRLEAFNLTGWLDIRSAHKEALNQLYRSHYTVQR